MIKLNLHEVKTHFSKYIELVEGGETVVICKRNIPVAEIRQLRQKTKEVPQLGWAEGQGKILPSFHKPLSERELRLWAEGHESDPVRVYAPKRQKRRK